MKWVVFAASTAIAATLWLPGRLQVTVNGQSMPVQSLTPAANGLTQVTFFLTQSFGGALLNLAVVVDGSSSAPFPLTVR